MCPGPSVARDADRRRDVDAGAAADRDALVQQQVEDLLQRLGVEAPACASSIGARLARLPGARGALADALGDGVALGLQLAGLHPGVERRCPSGRPARCARGLLRLQRRADAGQRAAGAAGAGEGVDAPAGLRPRSPGPSSPHGSAALARLSNWFAQSARSSGRELLGQAARDMHVVAGILEGLRRAPGADRRRSCAGSRASRGSASPAPR